MAEQVVVDINEDPVFSSMARMLDACNRPSESRNELWTICKVSDTFRNENPGAYDPQIVSIGPLHHGNPRLLPMEEIKFQFLHSLISRDPSNTLDKYIKAVSKPSFVKEITNCYSEQVVGAYGRNSFVETMVLDGCFIIEFFVRCRLGESMGELGFLKQNFSAVENDLLLIENQIPFKVLQVLFDLSCIPKVEISTFKELASRVFARVIISREIIHTIPEVVHHLLHLHYYILNPKSRSTSSEASEACWPVAREIIRKIKKWMWQPVFWVLSVLITCRRPTKYEQVRWKPRRFRSAIELYASGITFECKNTANSMDVTFRAIDGVMEIPLLSIRPTSISYFKNLVALEQDNQFNENHCTSYVTLMDSLIDTPEDVALLVRSGVLVSKLESNLEVANFFNRLGRGMHLNSKQHYLAKLFEDVDKYCSEEIHTWRTSMMHTYFSNPWTAISLFAAILLLFLTTLQTFFAVFAYARPPKP